MKRTIKEFAGLLKNIEKAAYKLADKMEKAGEHEGAINQLRYAAYLGLIAEMALSDDLEFMFSLYADE